MPYSKKATAGGFGLSKPLAFDLPEMKRADAETLVAKAHEVYACSNATRIKIDVEITVV